MALHKSTFYISGYADSIIKGQKEP